MNASLLKKLEPGKTIWDELVPGLHARGFKTGARFYVKYQSPCGSTRRPSLGPCAILSIAEARQLAKTMRAQALLGVDPKRAERDLKAQETLDNLWDEAFALSYDVEKKWSLEAQNIYTRNISPVFGRSKPGQITRFEVEAWHKTMAPATGNRALSVFSKFFEVIHMQILQSETFANPCLKVKRHKEKQRARYLSGVELGMLGAVLEREKSNDPRSVAFIYLLALTGSRPSAIERATWDCLTIVSHEGSRVGLLKVDGKTTAKTGAQDTVVVNSFILELLESLPRASTLTGIKAPRTFWESVRKEIGCDDVWMRDLRRTFATAGMSGGVGVDVIALLLNHTNYQTTLRYAKLDERVRLNASAQISTDILGRMTRAA